MEYIAKFHNVTYHVSNHKQAKLPLALIDRGANGGVAGSDTRPIDTTERTVHIQGIDDHMIKDVLIGTVSAVVNTQRGPVIVIMHQYARTGKGGTIHSSGQLEWYGNDVNDRSIKIEGGRQQLTAPDGYVIPSTSSVVCPTSDCSRSRTRNSTSFLTLSGRVKTIGILPLLTVSSLMTGIGMSLNLHLLYPIRCTTSMGSSVDASLSMCTSGRPPTSMHLTRHRMTRSL